MANDAAKKRETQRMRGRRELIYRPNTLVELHYAVLVMESCTTGVVRGQLSRILSSQEFAHNARLSSFLKFVVEQELSGCGDQLKESIIGVEVFGRRPDYDVRQDSVVRTEAGKLRARLGKYYATEGAAGQVVIELPKGGYRPVFRQGGEMPEASASLRSRFGRVSGVQNPCGSLPGSPAWRSRSQPRAGGETTEASRFRLQFCR